MASKETLITYNVVSDKKEYQYLNYRNNNIIYNDKEYIVKFRDSVAIFRHYGI